jgi:hypothetical protein
MIQAVSISGLQKYLTTQQWQHIKSALSNKSISPDTKEKIQHLLFSKYHGWAKNKAYQYKKKNSLLCKNIKIDAFTLYAELGLYKSIKSYNSSYAFYKHADLYISYYLYIGLSELYPLANLPHRYRVSKTWREKNTYLYKILMKPVMVDSVKDGFIYDKYYDNEILLLHKNGNMYATIWSIVNSLDPLSIRIFTYKYDYLLKKIRTNKEISMLECCSSETIRQNLKRTMSTIQEKLFIEGEQDKTQRI